MTVHLFIGRATSKRRENVHTDNLQKVKSTYSSCVDGYDFCRMEKQYGEAEEEPAPPYEESNTTTGLVEKPTQPLRRSITAQERAAELRQQRVKLLIDGHIEPLLEAAILHGDSQTIIIVPSDAIRSSTILSTTNLVNRPKTSSTHIVQLQGPNSTGSFWMQPRVVEGLEDGIREILYGQHERPRPTEVLPPRPANLSSPVSGQKSWLKRTFGAPSPDQDPTGSTGNWNLGWRLEHTSIRLPNASADGLSVRLNEVAFRTETELGLLTTTTAKCIIIELASTA